MTTVFTEKQRLWRTGLGRFSKRCPKQKPQFVQRVRAAWRHARRSRPRMPRAVMPPYGWVSGALLWYPGQVLSPEHPLLCLHSRRDKKWTVAQWLRFRLPMQGAWVRSLVRGDSTCPGGFHMRRGPLAPCDSTIEPVFHNKRGWRTVVHPDQGPQPLDHNRHEKPTYH